MLKNRTIVASIAASAASFAFADGEGDVGLLLDGDRIVTAVANDLDGTFADVGERVFGAELDFVSNLGDAPGFFTTDGPTLPGGFSPFAAGTTITYQTNGAVTAWNGAGFESTSNRLRQIQIPGVVEILSPVDDAIVDGFEYTYSGGDFDEHPDYAMTDETLDGVYLWKISFSALNGSGGLLASSDEAWVVFNFGVDDAVHEEALEWAEANIPAPGATALLAAGGLVIARRRRAE